MKDLFKYAHHLGFNNPYYFKSDKGLQIDTKFESIISKTSDKKSINPKAILAFLNRFYFLADDTLVNEIMRTPWMGVPDKNKSDWDFNILPKHKKNIKDEKDVAAKLFDLLCEDLIEYVGESKSVGILLSGGMDSRMAAGCLDHIIQSKQVDVERVVAYTWGDKDSRDQIYAKRIADALGWEFKSYGVGADEMWSNFMIAGIRGCEYSGIHLHAIPQIAETNDVDIMIAGSYGDSIGRAEYSRVTVDQLKPIDYKLSNKAGLLDPKVVKESKKLLSKDIDVYHKRFQKPEDYMVNEMDRQLHYMRRMINPCMEVIHEKTPFFQIFTSPKVFGYMWSLDISARNDKVYYYLLKHFSDEISEVPWARTGKRFMHNEDTVDINPKEQHSYSDIIQLELLDKIYNYVIDNKDQLSYINISSFKAVIKEIKRFPKHNSEHLEMICWLVSYTKFILTYQDKLNEKKSFNSAILASKGKLEYRVRTRARAIIHNLHKLVK